MEVSVHTRIINLTARISIVLSILLIAPSQNAQDDVLKLGATLVNVPVVVSDRQGRYISGLKKDDFTVYQDGVKQKISVFATDEEPLNISLLIDTSRSTHDVLGNIKKSAIEFIKHLRPQDKATVVSCDHEIKILCPLTGDRKTIENGIKSAHEPKRFGTVLRDAIEMVVHQSFAGVKGRKAIVMLTDGKDAKSHLAADKLLDLIEESDTMVYSIYYETFPDSKVVAKLMPRIAEKIKNNAAQKNIDAVEFLQEVSDDTAGRVYKSATSDLKKSFDLILDELRQQYFIGYYLDETVTGKDVHRITVVASPPDAAVRARRFYKIKSDESATTKK